MNNKIKLTFVRPPFEGMSDYCPPHLGIACLYSFLKISYGEDISCKLVDALPQKMPLEETIKQIESTNPDIVCITSKTMQAEQTIDILKFYEGREDVILICGGNHVSVEPGIFIDNGADFAIKGAGELALRKIIDSFITHDWSNIEKDYQIFMNTECSEKKLCVNIPHRDRYVAFKKAEQLLGQPNWDIFELEKYNENIHINKSKKALQVMASRGCPYKCSFCSSYLTWGTYVKYRPVKYVIDEILCDIDKYGITDFHFYDDNLMLNREWIEEFLDTIEKNGHQFNWICLTRPEIIYKNRDLLPRMKECGCKGFELGFETYSPKVYEKMNKKNSYESFTKAYAELVKNKFEMIEFLVMCFYIGETIQTLFDTYKQLSVFKKSSCLFASSRYFATPFMGTKFYEEHLKYGHDLYEGCKYKYAVYLNYMPNSFMKSCSQNLYIDENIFELVYFAYGNLDNIIYKEDFEHLIMIFSPMKFAQVFNEFMMNKNCIEDLCEYIYAESKVLEIYAVEEFVARMIELSISTGVMKEYEDRLC